jgi:RimJ/RimL family protein N-acetyltransferase
MNFRQMLPGDIDRIMVQERQLHSMLMAGDDYKEELIDHTLVCVGEMDGKIMIICGLTPIWEGRAVAWALISRHAPKHMLRITRRIQQFLKDAPFRRIEAQSDVNFEQAHKWLEILGFRQEGFARGFYPDGGDAYLWSRLRECHSVQ